MIYADTPGVACMDWFRGKPGSVYKSTSKVHIVVKRNRPSELLQGIMFVFLQFPPDKERGTDGLGQILKQLLETELWASALLDFS